MAIMDSKVVAGLLRARRAVPLLLLAVVLLNISFAGTAHSQSCSYPNSNIWINVDGATPPGPVNVQENSAGVATFTVNWGGSEPHGDNGVVFYLVQSSTPPDPCSSEASGNGYSIDAGSILPSGSMPFTWNIGNPASLTIWVAAVDISNNQATDWVQVNLLPAGSGNSGGSSGISANGIVAVVCGVYYAVSTMIFLLGLTLMILGGAIYAGSHFVPGSTRGTLQGYSMGMLMGGVIGVLIAVIAPYVLSVITGNSMLTSVCI